MTYPRPQDSVPPLASEAPVATAAPTVSKAPASSTGARPSAGVWVRRMMIVSLIVAAVNLRPAVTSLGPVLQEVRHGLDMSNTVAGLLTSVPTLCFALFGVAAPKLEGYSEPFAVV